MKHKRQFPNTSSYNDRHGKRRWRYRKGAFSAELGSAYGSQEFIERYEAAKEGHRTRGLIGADRTIPRSFSALVASYYKSAEFLALESSTKKNYRGIIERLRREHGNKRVSHLERRHIANMMADRSDTPNAANNMRKRLAQLLDHAILLDWRIDNPAKNVKPYKIDNKGFHTWDEGEIKQFFGYHGPETIPHRAVGLMLYTGAARADVVKMGWGNIKNGRIEYRRQKTIKSSGVPISSPIHPDLQVILENCPKDIFTFLETSHGKSRTAEGFGNAMRGWCNEAGLKNCTAHGLRKACARRLAEAGATPHEIQSITGHKTLSEVDRYTKEANRENLANSASMKLENSLNQEQTLVNLSNRFANKPPKQLKRSD